MQARNQIVYTLAPEDEGRKFEVILYRRFHLSRKQLQKIKEGEHAWLDGKFVYLNTRGKAGQILIIDILEDQSATIAGESLPIDILYEDDLFLAANKPAGQVVHPNSLYPSGTLGNAVVDYWEQKGEYRPFRPISRIDRNTSGIVLIGKNRYAHQQIARLSSERSVQKKYLGFVEGRMPLDAGAITLSIRVQAGSRIVREIHPDGQPSETLYRTLQTYTDYSLVEFTLVTGRTHQIRVHSQGIGHPLLGDDLYGGNHQFITRQALHCHSYSFIHPLKDQLLCIAAPLPDDMNALIEPEGREKTIIMSR